MSPGAPDAAGLDDTLGVGVAVAVGVGEADGTALTSIPPVDASEGTEAHATEAAGAAAAALDPGNKSEGLLAPRRAFAAD